MEDPGLGVETGGAEVVGNAHIGAKAGQLVERSPFGGAGVDGGEHTQRSAAFAVTTERREKRVDAAASDEGHDDIDGVGRIDFGVELVEQARLAGRVGEKRGVEEWDERFSDRLRGSVGSPFEDRVQAPQLSSPRVRRRYLADLLVVRHFGDVPTPRRLPSAPIAVHTC